MSDAIFDHYIVCPRCKRQLRIGRYGFALLFGGSSVLVGQRCCDTVWINQGVVVDTFEVGREQRVTQVKVWLKTALTTGRRRRLFR